MFFSLQIIRELKNSETDESESQSANGGEAVSTESEQSGLLADEMGDDSIPIEENIDPCNNHGSLLISEVDVQYGTGLENSTTADKQPSCSREVQTSLPCTECAEKKDKIESLQKVRSKQKQRLQTRYKRIRDLERENKILKQVCYDILRSNKQRACLLICPSQGKQG